MRTLILFGLAAAAFGATHPDLNGTWQSSDKGETIAIHQSDDGIQIAETVNDKQTEVRCNTTGQACKSKDGEVSFWYNGPALVMMETSHGNSRVVKKRWVASDDGKTLTLEVIHIAPQGSSEKLAFNRRSGS